MESAIISPDRGFLTEWICPCTSACTSEYSKDKSVFSISSRFHPDHRWGNFWSFGAGWLINHESWFNASWVDMLKVKASIGSQGNDSIGDYLYTDLYSISNNEGQIAIAFGSKGNKEITWETNTNMNAGVDFDLFSRRRFALS